MFDPSDSLAEIQAAKAEISEAADAILFAAETSLARLAAFHGGESGALADIERALCAILGACAFQDISGQRLSKVEDLLCGVERPGADALAQGPALARDRLDQTAADAVFASLGPSDGAPAASLAALSGM
jgi:hypothetical protein